MSADKAKGKCEGCGNSPRILTKIESGQQVCRTCLREIRGPRIDYVSPDAVESLRKKGFDVPDRVTREEYHRLSDQYLRDCYIKELRAAGKAVGNDTPLAELERLRRIVRLQQRRVEIPDSATVGEIELQESLRTYSNKVVGVSKKNRDGTSRQEIISRCRQWERLCFRPEPENPVDPNAIAVCRSNGEQIGYLNADLAEIVSECIGRGWRYYPFIKMILDDGDRFHDRGVVMLVIAAMSHVPQETLRQYASDAVRTAQQQRPEG